MAPKHKYARVTPTYHSPLAKKKSRVECDICTNRFSATKWKRVPMVGQCGHSFCRGCIYRMDRKCAKCRALFIPSKNYALIEALEELDELKLKLKELKRISQKMTEFIEYFEEDNKDETDNDSEEEQEAKANQITAVVYAEQPPPQLLGNPAVHDQAMNDIPHLERDEILEEFEQRPNEDLLRLLRNILGRNS